MYYKKFSQKEIQILRQAIQELGQNFVSMIEDGDDNWKKDLKLVEKIEKKLVHLYYLDRGNKWNYLSTTMWDLTLSKMVRSSITTKLYTKINLLWCIIILK